MLPTTPAQTQAQAQIMSQQAALQNKNPAIQNKEHGSLDGVQPVNPPGSALAIQHPQGGDMRKAPTSFTFLALLNADVNSFTKYLSNYFESHPGNEDHQKQSGKALGKTLDAAGKTISQALANPNAVALPEAITPDLLNSFKETQEKLQTQSADIYRHTGTILPYDPKLTQRSHAEIALHFILEAKFNKAVENLAQKAKAPPLQIQAKPITTPPIQIGSLDEHDPTIESNPATETNTAQKNPALENHNKQSVSGQDHRCWLRSLWFVIFSKLTKSELTANLKHIFPNNSRAIEQMVSNLHSNTINGMIDSINYPETPFTFDANTEQALFDLSNQILHKQGKAEVSQGAMGDTEQMDAIANELGLSFVHGQAANLPLKIEGQGSLDNPFQTVTQQNIHDEPVIIGGRGGLDPETGKEQGDDHFSLYLPRDTQLFQEQLKSLLSS